ncbi:hypothetical protein DM02DRAFT_686909 [Periconia macrospinosa]|uniref:BTB domain-containing protein n=1 Tax=Periconia macrospinosa TaxID=97972 RepID=A0A2V1DHS5_9PLEO|nr:hypothetical protein DM02DRAFT_686909 [Periconia macrospinosa]
MAAGFNFNAFNGFNAFSGQGLPVNQNPGKENEAENSRKRKFDYLGDDMMSVRCSRSAGLASSNSAKVSISVHKSLITADSEFFRAALKPEWKPEWNGGSTAVKSEGNGDATAVNSEWNGGATPTVDLEEEDVEMVKMYIHFLYKRIVDFEVHGNITVSYGNLFKAYGFGEKIISNEFQNATMRAIIEYQYRIKTFPGNDSVQIAYQKTPPNSPLRRLVVDYWAKAANLTAWQIDLLPGMNCPEFLHDLIKALLENRPAPDFGKYKLWRNRQHEFLKKLK